MSDGAAHRQALADKIRGGHQRRARRRRAKFTIFIVVALMVVFAFVAWFQLRPDGEKQTDVVAPEHATEDFGFKLTPELAGHEAGADTDTVEVKIFEDFLCPSCKIFHEESSEYLAEQVAAGTISISYHPFVFLLGASSDEYAQRAANAAVCVADHAGVVAYVTMHGLLLENQPNQGGPGLSDSELLGLASETGVEAGEINECVAERTFDPWVEQALEVWRKADVTTTPTVRVGGLNVVRSNNGQESMPGPAELRIAIEAAQ